MAESIDPELEYEADHLELPLTGEVPALAAAEDTAVRLVAENQKDVLARAINGIETLAAINAAIGRGTQLTCGHVESPHRACHGCMTTHAETISRIQHNDGAYGHALAALLTVQVAS